MASGCASGDTVNQQIEKTITDVIETARQKFNP